jgi:hypothetical protein
MSEHLIIISHQPEPENRLIKITDGPQPDWCMSCGREDVIKFWSGRVMSCIECAKGANVARQFGTNIYQPGMSYKEFKEQLDIEEQRYYMLERLQEDGLTYPSLKSYIRHNDCTLNQAIEQLYLERIIQVGGQ